MTGDRFPIACLIVLVLLLCWARVETGEWIWQDDSQSQGHAHFECPLPAATYYRIRSVQTGAYGPWRTLQPAQEACP